MARGRSAELDAVPGGPQPVYNAAKFAAPDSGLGFSRLSPLLFGTNGIAPLGYAAFAFALGLAAGVLIKRTVPAMAVTLAVFAFVLLAWPSWVRPHLITPVREPVALRGPAIQGLGISGNQTDDDVRPGEQAGAWVLSDQAVNSAGQPFAGQATTPASRSQQACNKSIVALHLRQSVIYQPASRFWAFRATRPAPTCCSPAVLAWRLCAGCWITDAASPEPAVTTDLEVSRHALADLAPVSCPGLIAAAATRRASRSALSPLASRCGDS